MVVNVLFGRDRTLVARVVSQVWREAIQNCHVKNVPSNGALNWLRKRYNDSETRSDLAKSNEALLTVVSCASRKDRIDENIGLEPAFLSDIEFGIPEYYVFEF